MTIVVSGAGSITGVAVNGPAFYAYKNANQNINHDTLTKLTFPAEDFDTNNCFDSVTNHRFQPNIAGYYLITAGATLQTFNSAHSFLVTLYKNGVIHANGSGSVPTAASYPASGLSVVVYLNGSTDYVEAWGYAITGGSTLPVLGDFRQRAYFSGALVRV